MIEEIKIISEEEINEKGVCAAPTVLAGPPEENKKMFDRLCREVVIPRLNSLIAESKVLKQESTQNTQTAEELENAIEVLINDIGDISEVDISGSDLCQKIIALKEAFLQSVVDINRSIGALDNLEFVAPSVVSALNYLYDMVSPNAISEVSSLYEPKDKDLMKIVKTFDVAEGKHKLFVCNAKFPKISGLSAGDVCGRLYFDPYVVKERYASFRSANLEKFTEVVERKHYMNIMTLVSQNDETVKAYLQIRYSTSLDGYVLAFSNGDGYSCIWASDNFSMDGISHVKGYTSGFYTDLCSGYVIEQVEENISWLVCSEEFESEFYWEELGSSNISDVETDISASKSGRYTTLVLTKGESAKSVVIEDGIDGYTPKKGQDYFTEKEIEEISASIESNLKKEIDASLCVSPEFARTTDECTDETKMYVLPDGYVYAYLQGEETAYNFAIALSANVKVEYGEENSISGYVTTGYIPITWIQNYVVRVYASDIYMDGTTSPISIEGYSSDKEFVGIMSDPPYTTEEGWYTIELVEKAFPNGSVDMVRISVRLSQYELNIEDDVVKSLFIDLPNENKTTLSSGWQSTGVQFVSSEYTSKVNELEQMAHINTDNIYLLEQQLDGLEKHQPAYPSLWDSAVAEATEKIKEKTKAFGRNGVTFAFFSDNHKSLGYSADLISNVAKECNIPFVFYGGDSGVNGTVEAPSEIEANEKEFSDFIKCIPEERFCRAIGEYDGSYTLHTGEKYHLPWEEKYSLLMSPMAVFQNRVFGGDGTYYYTDDITSKTRFIVLNSVWFNYKTNADGTVNNTDGYGFGEEQIKWLCDVLLELPEDMSVVLVSHSPVTNNDYSNLRDAFIVQGVVNAFVNGETYTGNYSDGNDIENNASVYVSFDKKGKVIGWFSGHIHKDVITSFDAHTGNKLSFNTVTITSDADMSHDSAEDTREGDTECAVDFVTVNKKTGEVYIVRLGVGSDRTYNYLEV
ncbi:MAG: hypothetical protein E7614_07725 [Ruminococcaceae bacterium]|nr:hypothetical protein [Oscillospiraceae bacterium]